MSVKKFFAVSGCENSLSNALEQAAGPETGRNKISSIQPPYSINIYFDNDPPSSPVSPSLLFFHVFWRDIERKKNFGIYICLADPGGRAV